MKKPTSKVGMLNPVHDRKIEHVPRGRRDDITCYHGVSRRSLRETPPTSKAGE